MSQLSIPFGLGRLKPDFIADADQFSQRLNVQSGFAQQDLQVARAEFVNAICGVQKPFGNVLAHARHLLRSIIAPLQYLKEMEE